MCWAHLGCLGPAKHVLVVFVAQRRADTVKRF